MVSCRQRGSVAGNIITLLLLLGIVGLGLWLWLGKKAEAPATGANDTATPADGGDAKPAGDAPEPIEPVTGSPTLEAANTFVPKDNILRIDISEYAGYGGLIVANGGLDPNPDSIFAKEYGFQVQISMSEDETWGPLNNGKLAATATTADALAVLGRQFEAIVPVQIGYSRGADMVVVDPASRPSMRSRARRWPPRNSTRASSSSATWRRRPAFRSPCCAISIRNRRPERWGWCSTKTRSSPVMPICTNCRAGVRGSMAAWAGRPRPTKSSKRRTARPRCWSPTATCWWSRTCWP